MLEAARADRERRKVNDPLHIKYRPTVLADVIGQDAVVGSLKRLFKNRKTLPHAFLFLGPSGTGKTTLARILATMLECSQVGLMELDAATHSGIDAMRSVLDTVKYRALGDKPTKVIVVDECHALSKATWQSLLLAIEEPPPHAFWMLCTTEAEKVPRTIKTRCHSFTLHAVPQGELGEFLEGIAEEEEMDVEDDILQLCAKQAFGSVRQALVNLSTVHGCTDRKEAYRLLASVLEEGEAIELARALVRGIRWKEAMEILLRLQDEQAESVRLVVVNYVQRALLDATENKAPKLLAILQAFSTPCNPSERLAPLQLAIGELLDVGTTR